MKAKPGAVTIERLERALAIAARIVVMQPAVAPIFKRLERELAAARAASAGG